MTTTDYQDNLVPVQHDYVCQVGETFVREFFFPNEEDPTDLSDYTAATMAVKKDGRGSSLLDLTKANGRITLNVDEDGNTEDGLVRLVVADDITAALTASRRGKYTLLLVNADGETTVARKGRFIIEAAV